MFGHQDEPQQPQNDAVTPTPPAPVSDGALDATLQTLANEPDTSTAVPPVAIEAHETDGYMLSDVPGQLASPTITTPSVADPVTATPTPAADTNTLLDIKQQALQQLSPLVNHLDQGPEEKFRTTMMMIQASDNQDLIKTAYESAQAIGDEKARAQALLDIVNEINYFTQHQND